MMVSATLEGWSSRKSTLRGFSRRVYKESRTFKERFQLYKKMVWTQEQHTVIEKDHLGDRSPEKNCC